MEKISRNRRRVLGGLSALMAGDLAAQEGQGKGKAGAKPNIVFIIADDMGYADMGAYGQVKFKTPHLDRLAAQGIRFTQSYANSPVCSASRFGLITGRYQYRLRAGLEEPLNGLPEKDVHGLPPEHPTLLSQLKKVGYNTALIGKWHLGPLPRFGPLKSGYDYFFGNYGPAVDYFNHKYWIGPLPADGAPNILPDVWENEVRADQAGYYTDVLTERSIDYINKQDGKTPFMLSVHYTAPHWPWQGPGDAGKRIGLLIHYDGGSLEKYYELMGTLDSAVGKIMKALEKRGLAENTIVIFTSDNGGERFSDQYPFSGQKTELLEGGIRVPTVMRWPKMIKPRQVSDQMMIGMDWMPTLLAAAGGAADPAYPLDGENLLPVMLGKAPVHQRTLYWRYKSSNQRALRSGNWKYLKINENEFLFDLAADVRERANVAKLHPEVFNDLKAKWETWNQGMLPITADVFTHHLTPLAQADRYVTNDGDPKPAVPQPEAGRPYPKDAEPPKP